MAKRKVKAGTPSETLPAVTNSTEDIAQAQNKATTSVLEASSPTVDSTLAEEPVVEKTARIAKKKTTKSRTAKPLAEKTAFAANELVEEKGQTAELSVVEEPAVEAQIQTMERATSEPVIETALEEALPATKKSAKEKGQASEKAVKMKRLTLDIPKPLHKAIKAQAVEEGSSIVDMLRTLLEQHYGK